MSETNEIGVWLYRIRRGNETFYSTVRTIGKGLDVELLGIATRPPQQRIDGTTDENEFYENVDAVANEVRWFEPLRVNCGSEK